MIILEINNLINLKRLNQSIRHFLMANGVVSDDLQNDVVTIGYQFGYKEIVKITYNLKLDSVLNVLPEVCHLPGGEPVDGGGHAEDVQPPLHGGDPCGVVFEFLQRSD